MKAALGAAAVCFALAYPFAVYLGLTRLGPRAVALVVLALVLLGAALGAARRRSGSLLKVLLLPLSAAVLLATAAVLDNPAFILSLPVLTNLVFLAQFGGSLLGEVPLVETFARLAHPDLSAPERRYCRSVTWIWSGYFVFNAVVCLLLAVAAPLSWWTAYTGVIAYVLMGALFTIEYLVRKYRFGRFGNGPHDRLLEWAFRAVRAVPEARHR